MNNPAAQPLTGWRALLRDLVQMIRFYSRLPVPQLPFERDVHAPPNFSTAPRMLPIAGLIIGLPAACVLYGLTWLGLPATPVAALTVTVAVLSTGAFHEDGLADTFDGLGGGWTAERRLDIMKDSRIGSYGAAALVLSLILRVTLLSALLEDVSALAAALLYLATASLSRCIGLAPILLLPPARASGLSSTVGKPNRTALVITALLILVIGMGLTSMARIPLTAPAIGFALATAIALLMTYWAKRAIGGQTGDIAGACQQLAESALYVGLLTIIYP